MRRFVSASETTTNVHGCWFAPDGAVPATSIAFRISSSGTGSEEKNRTDRRVRMRSRNASERASASSGSRRLNVERKRLVARLGLQDRKRYPPVTARTPERSPRAAGASPCA